MSREDRLSRILGKAAPDPESAPEPVPERAENVLSLPVRSAWLKNTEQGLPPPPGTEVPVWLGRLIVIGPYAAAVSLALVLLVLVGLIRQSLIYAEVGRSTCATVIYPEDKLYWLAEDPGSEVPILKARQLSACDDARRLF